ncbi:unconventional prefoldin RPB5 interactor-like protein isoform X2 [Belonocnema kinseyi]|uniref:unconventional prefoldin RPB5 interactor-like protein isoform X2 n=1 Tax=Belonocnema kinseyi TaxID=2817044 RepID=UPI00143D09F7|nr:unconventional prefoldin RPB5 interactor-like protein isoform X2 [Belonocnema kinseyi]
MCKHIHILVTCRKGTEEKSSEKQQCNDDQHFYYDFFVFIFIIYCTNTRRKEADVRKELMDRKILQKNEERTQIWTLFQNKHKLVLEGLQRIPLDFTINCLVPIGKHALMEGKLKHTSEILVCLGEGYFINYTAGQAIELCNRRMKHVETILTYLKEERSLFESRQNLPVSCGAFRDNINEEIIEHWNEKDLNNWRAQHRQREKEHHEKIAQQRQHKSYSETEEDLFLRLDELELEEELADEYYRLQEEDVEDDGCKEGEEEGEIEQVFRESKKYEELKRNTTLEEIPFNVLETDIIKPLYVETKKVRKYLASGISLPPSEETEENHDIIASNETLKEENDFSKSHAENKNQLGKDRRVSFADVYDLDSFEIDERANQTNEKKNSYCELNYKKINFSHSKVLPQLIDDANRFINNPADIYNIFYKPKSILKYTRNTLSQSDDTSLPKTYALDKDFESEPIWKSVYEDVMMKVVQEKKVERTQAEAIESLNKKKPVSRFRLERSSLHK